MVYAMRAMQGMGDDITVDPECVGYVRRASMRECGHEKVKP